MVFCVIPLSLSISFIMYDEPNYITENKPHMQSMFESLKPSLDICYTIWNQILYYMQQLCPAFWDSFFAGLPASPAVKCSRSMLVFFLSEVNTLRIGPQQVCRITFKAEQNNVEKLRLN